MRPIKFRAWDKFNTDDDIDIRMKKVSMIDFIGKQVYFVNEYNEQEPLDFGRCEIMQFTGLKDKNGKEIYEGDVVYDGWKKYQVVLGHPATFVFQAENMAYLIDRKTLEETEVIGNIYSNPELLQPTERK